jgi:hypothetical protein
MYKNILAIVLSSFIFSGFVLAEEPNNKSDIQKFENKQEELSIKKDRAFIALSSLLLSDYISMQKLAEEKGESFHQNAYNNLIEQVEYYKEQKINQINDATKEVLETIENDYIDNDALFFKRYIENIEKKEELRIKDEIIKQQELDIEILKNDMEIKRLKIIKEAIGSGAINPELLDRIYSTN